MRQLLILLSAYLLPTIILLIGWFLNIIQLFSAGPISAWGGYELVKAFGVIVIPLGSLMGWIGIF